PDVIADTKRFLALSKEEGSLRETVETFKHYKQVVESIEENEEILREEANDSELEKLAKEELKDLRVEKESLEEQIKILLLPNDPNDDKNIIMEIHGAAGGDEGRSEERRVGKEGEKVRARGHKD